jgi:protoheme IX farnesyltransferase
MLPVTHGVEFTQLQILLYTILLVVVTLMPFVLGMSGVFYLGGVLVLDAGFVYYALRLMFGDDERVAMQTFAYSIIYLTALFTFLLVDHYLPAIQSLFV